MEKYIKEINYWLLSRMNRYVVALIYTIVGILMAVLLFVFVRFSRDWLAQIFLFGIFIAPFLFFYTVILRSLPSRKKKKNDEEEEFYAIFTDEELEQIQIERKKNKHYNDWIDETFDKIRKKE